MMQQLHSLALLAVRLFSKKKRQVTPAGGRGEREASKQAEISALSSMQECSSQQAFVLSFPPKRTNIQFISKRQL